MVRNYQKLVAQWEIIIASSMPDEDKKAACLAALQRHVDQLAASRVGQINAPLRFFADMFALETDTRLGFTRDHLLRVAVIPAHLWIKAWLEDKYELRQIAKRHAAHDASGASMQRPHGAGP